MYDTDYYKVVTLILPEIPFCLIRLVGVYGTCNTKRLYRVVKALFYMARLGLINFE